MTPEEVAAAIKRQRDTCRFDDTNAGHVAYEEQWVVCTDRLPHQTGVYYVTKSHKMYGRKFAKIRWVADQGCYNGNWQGLAEGWEVVAWLPYAMPYLGRV